MVSFCCFQVQCSKTVFCVLDLVFHILCSILGVHDLVFTIVCLLFCVAVKTMPALLLFLKNKSEAFRLASLALPLSDTSGTFASST